MIYFVVNRCVNITDIGVGYLSTMPCVQVLFLRWCSQIRDSGVQHLSTMRSLEILSLAGNMIDDDVYVLAFKILVFQPLPFPGASSNENSFFIRTFYKIYETILFIHPSGSHLSLFTILILLCTY